MKGWTRRSFPDVVFLQEGPGIRKYEYQENGYPMINVRCVQDGFIDMSTAKAANTELALGKWAHFQISEGDILFTISGTIGRSAIVKKDDLPILMNTSVVRFRSKTEDLDQEFLYHLVSSGEFIEALKKVATGTAQKNVGPSHLKKMTICYPPLPEQKRIVAILDEAFEGIDRAIANTEKNLANARELLHQSIFDGYDTKGWQSTQVVELLPSKKGYIRTGPFGSQLLHSEFVDEGVAVLGIDNAVNNGFKWGKRRFITSEKYQQLSRYRVKPGDVLITIMGTCGRCAVVPDDIPIAINTKHLCCITLDRDKCLPHFLHIYFLYHPVARQFLESRAKGSIMAGLNMSIIKELPVLLPSIAEQKLIINRCNYIVEGVQRLEEIYQRKLEALQELKQSILHKAFTGELTNPTIKEAAA